MRYLLQPDYQTLKDTVQDNTMWCAIWAVAYGVVTFTGGDIAWKIQAYRTALLVPYSPESWGVVLVLLGLGMFFGMHFGKNKLMTYSILLAGIWNIFFAGSFLREYILTFIDEENNAGIGLGPFVTYMFIAGCFLLRWSSYRRKNAAS